MLAEILALAETAPITGDTFPAKTLIMVGVLAVGAAVGTALLSKKKNDDDDNDNDE